MELVSLVLEAAQAGAEHAASYRLGQSALRQLDRVLWVVEKCARWAVPPPLDQDERPPPELVRPLPWVFFLMMLVALRITRESISLLNLVMGKPPLRSADVVMYIQSKRRYLRTLKYQGTRLARLRTTAPASPRSGAAWGPWVTWVTWAPWGSWGSWGSWPGSLGSLLQLTMCFRRHPHYANNNSTTQSNNDEVLVVKRSKRGREKSSPVVSGSETTMERLIEKMMVDLDADSDEDSSFTLTNVTSPKSYRSDCTVESDQDTFQNDTQTSQEQPLKQQEKPPTTRDTQEPKDLSTTQNDTQKSENDLQTSQNGTKKILMEPPTKEIDTQQPKNEILTTQINTESEDECEVKALSSTPEKKTDLENLNFECSEIPKELFSSPDHPAALSPKEETQEFLQIEASSRIPRTSNNEQKIANGRTVRSVPSKKKGAHGHGHGKDRRNSERGAKTVSANNSV